MTTPTIRAIPLLFGAVLVLALPDAARACAMCVSAQDDSVQAAFAVASLFMTAMPLSVIGGIVWYLRRRARQVAAEEAAGVIHLPLGPDRPSRRD